MYTWVFYVVYFLQVFQQKCYMNFCYSNAWEVSCLSYLQRFTNRNVISWRVKTVKPLLHNFLNLPSLLSSYSWILLSAPCSKMAWIYYILSVLFNDAVNCLDYTPSVINWSMSMQCHWSDTHKKTGVFGEVSVSCHFAHHISHIDWDKGNVPPLMSEILTQISKTSNQVLCI